MKILVIRQNSEPEEADLLQVKEICSIHREIAIDEVFDSAAEEMFDQDVSLFPPQIVKAAFSKTHSWTRLAPEVFFSCLKLPLGNIRLILFAYMQIKKNQRKGKFIGTNSSWHGCGSDVVRSGSVQQRLCSVRYPEDSEPLSPCQ